MSTESTGKVDFIVGANTYQTWYKIFGELKNNQHRPVVVVHGGPGMTHHYMLPHKTIYSETGTPVLFYDQIGNGASSHCPDVPKEFWTPELFMDELDNLLKALGIYEDFDLLGQSWGGMLGGQYAASRTPKGLKRLIIANSPASIELASMGTNALLNEFPQDFVKMMRKHEADGTTEAQEYQEGTMQFYNKHICTLNPWPEDLQASFAAVAQNPTVYHTMLGPSEFNVIGTMKDWTIVDILHRIPYPTLLISSPTDEIQECAVLPFFLNIPKVKWVELQNSSHLAMFEEPERYFKVILDFLKATEIAK
ncbi:Alpha/Beta hydrolase protein [Crassisporium funariophilum]|nr:Alpha/Beta hydrolase protein [Crassisporium funariophilum]